MNQFPGMKTEKKDAGVVKLEYADDQTSNEDDYQAQFDQIANSIKIK
jgi:hypothetical protein